MIPVSVLIVDIDFPGGKCNLKMNITGEKGIKQKFIYVSLLKCNVFRMKIAKLSRVYKDLFTCQNN